MKKTNLLICLLIMAVFYLNAGAQDLFSPISKTGYQSWDKYIDKYFTKYADVNFIMPSDMMISPDILESLVMFGGDLTVTSQEGKEYNVKCSPELYRSLKLLAKHSVMTSSYVSDYMGFDGQTYFLFYNFDGVRCWSPYGMCRDIVSVFSEVMKAVRDNDIKRLDKQIVVADSLRHSIKRFYSKEVIPITVTVSIPWTQDNKPAAIKHLSLYSSNLDVVFTFDNKDYKEEYRALYREKYGRTIQQVAHWIYALSDIADDENYVSFIVDDNVTEPQVSKDGKQYEIKLKESDLTARKMLSLIQLAYK